jgi:hypothetical protein
MRSHRRQAAATALFGALLAVGCASTSIAIKEQLGYAKREQLVDSVQDARDDQEAAKEQFASALEEFLAVTKAKPTELEEKYDTLRRAYERSEDKADAVRDRVRDVERVAEALFSEWKAELGQYTSESLRRASESQLAQTRDQYGKLIGAMRNAEGSMAPVLAAFKDQVLFLKHNLNAQAIASLSVTVGELQSEVGRLIAEMEASIAEANTFIERMGE